jgi:hypothetical protein
MPEIPLSNPVRVLPVVVRDGATVTVTGGVIPAGSTLTFARYGTADCTGPSFNETVAVPAGAATATVYSSPYTFPGGTASYKATFNSGNTATVPNAVSPCEPMFSGQSPVGPQCVPIIPTLCPDPDLLFVPRTFTVTAQGTAMVGAPARVL